MTRGRSTGSDGLLKIPRWMTEGHRAGSITIDGEVKVIGDEPCNTDRDPNPSEKASEQQGMNGAAFSPSTPCAMNRACHLHTTSFDLACRKAAGLQPQDSETAPSSSRTFNRCASG